MRSIGMQVQAWDSYLICNDLFITKLAILNFDRNNSAYAVSFRVLT